MKAIKNYVNEVLSMRQLQPESQIFCDMDGVVVDFLSTATDDINRFLEQAQENPDSLSRGAAKIYRRVLRDLGPDFRAATEDDLRLKAIRSLSFFLISYDPGRWFSQLNELDDGVNLLWPFIIGTGRKVQMLTAGVPHKRGMPAADGKRIWVREHLFPAPNGFNCVPAVEKQNFAMVGGVPNILIDDKARTINQWNAAGGIGILHVTKRSADTIEQLKAVGA